MTNNGRPADSSRRANDWAERNRIVGDHLGEEFALVVVIKDDGLLIQRGLATVTKINANDIETWNAYDQMTALAIDHLQELLNSRRLERTIDYWWDYVRSGAQGDESE